MVYIYRKIIGNKPYYYLRASERKGDKIIVKDVSYLGNSIEEVKISLAKLKKYKEDIRKAYKTIHNFVDSNYYLEKVKSLKLRKDEFLADKLYGVEACKLHYNAVFKKQNALTKKEILKHFIIEFAYNTASIEGNTITLKEAKNLLMEGLTPKDRTLREIYDLQNTEIVFNDLFNSNEDISHDLMIKVHTKLMANIDSRIGYRLHDVRVIQAGFKATPAPYVKIDMDILLKWYNLNKKSLHPLVLATIFHHKFEKIHPFMDGNGRTGRMLLNFILMRNEHPPLIISKKERNDYLNSLKEADRIDLNSSDRKSYLHLVQFVADEMGKYYWSAFL